ncbi:ATP-binding protein [Limnohabitans sp. Jir72]|uniref:histidine kinase n=1 Tax=Limnohabitans sp. Jir72 TaxID=1977909 RepID=UPI0013050331|nr:ATP-binding protein [Limnohabitans sp. Jir72]
MLVSSSWRDGVSVLAAVLGFVVLTSKLELSERLVPWLRQHEALQLDELPLTLLVLSLSLAWFAWRRVRDAQAELMERKAAQVRVSELLAHNRDLTQRLFTAQEDERQLLARDLHDEVGQACTALRIEAAYIAKAAHAQPEQVVSAAQRVDDAAHRMHRLARDMLTRLRPAHLDSLGLERALHELCRNWQMQCGVACTFVAKGLPDAFLDYASISVYRLIQEALTNVARHARATRVQVAVVVQGDALMLSIEDNGCGIPVDAEHALGLGCVGMHERVASLHGAIVWQDARPGVHVVATLPLVSLLKQRQP